MLPLSDLQSLNEYIIIRKMSEFKYSYGIFNIVPLLIVNKTIIALFFPEIYDELIMVIANS